MAYVTIISKKKEEISGFSFRDLLCYDRDVTRQ